MTLADALAKIDVSRFPLKMKIAIVDTIDGHALSVTTLVKHRDTGIPVMVELSEIYPDHLRGFLAPDPVAWIHSRIKRAVLHELDECFLVSGVRTFDPHREPGSC